MDEEATAAQPAENEEFRFQTVGEQLQAARTDGGKSLNEVAAQTRIPIRHLEALEKSDFAALPGSTYSVGFAKAYARFLGMDANSVASELRAELAQGGHAGFTPATPSYEPADPTRVPSRWLAWTAAGIALAVLIGYFVWRSFAFAPDAAEPAIANDAPAKVSPAADKAAPAATGEVVLTAKEAVWMRVYDAQKKRLFEAEMKAGDSFAIPTNADGPMINTGRPQSLKVTIGGQEVAPLGPPERAIKDVGVSAAALLARTPDSAPSTQSPPATK